MLVYQQSHKPALTNKVCFKPILENRWIQSCAFPLYLRIDGYNPLLFPFTLKWMDIILCCQSVLEKKMDTILCYQLILENRWIQSFCCSPVLENG